MVAICAKVDGREMSEIIIYQSNDNQTQIEVKFENDTFWLSLNEISDLFERDKSVISRHLKNIFTEGELDRHSVVAKNATTAADGKIYEVEFYNLEAIISVGYRVNSKRGTQFRQWATQRLKEYLIKGFTIDSERIKDGGGGYYWKELLNTIRDIRSSEKVMYRQVLDLYATAIDYSPQAAESIAFFKIVQNKLHFAAHGHTAAEVIYFRVDSDKPFAGLTNFKGPQPSQAEALIAKNYLQAEELKVLNNLVSAYFDLAEINAIEKKAMKMADYIAELDHILSSTRRKILPDAGRVSHANAVEKAKTEFRKYENKTLSEVEKAYLERLKQIEKQVKKKK